MATRVPSFRGFATRACIPLTKSEEWKRLLAVYIQGRYKYKSLQKTIKRDWMKNSDCDNERNRQLIAEFFRDGHLKIHLTV